MSKFIVTSIKLTTFPSYHLIVKISSICFLYLVVLILEDARKHTIIGSSGYNKYISKMVYSVFLDH